MSLKKVAREIVSYDDVEGIAATSKKIAHEIVNPLNPKLREELQKEV